MDLRKQLIEFEGWRNRAYPDPLTGAEPWTIGVGHTGTDVTKNSVWTDEQVNAALDADIQDCIGECRENFPWFDQLNEPRKAVIVGMCFQMGIGRLLKFRNTLGAVRDERWAVAAEGMRQSQWARQTPKRAIRLAHQMETGDWS